jgi:hypothetical protein
VLDASNAGKDPVTNLQSGLAIELAVLPPYLYALWSLKSAQDGASKATLEAARTIRAVVYEEMLHAGLVGNLINALGGTPLVGKPPMTYPNPLPGHVKGGPGPGWVSLEPLSPNAIKAFMAIELPDWIDKAQPPPDSWTTIAELYHRIDTDLQTGNWPIQSRRQLPLSDNPGPGQLLEVIDLPTARTAIETIIDQGEGHQVPPPGQPPGEAEDDDDHEVAHYDQFAAISGYLADGKISMKSDVWPLVKDPRASDYSTTQQQANTAFNTAYSELLDSLAVQLAADAPRIYGTPTDRMNELARLAAILRNTGPLQKQPTKLPGPTFEYVPPAERGAA